LVVFRWRKSVRFFFPSMSCTLTLVWTATGRSESLSVDPASTTVGNLTEWATALFGQTGALQLSKEGRLLSAPSQTLQQAGLINGDLVAVARPAPPPAAAAAAAGGGGLDFSSLLAGGRPPTAASPPAAPTRTTPVYYPGMNLDDAIQYNPHPAALASLLLSKGHLMKELNYHNPRLAAELQRPGLTTEQAADIWRNEMVKVRRGEAVVGEREEVMVRKPSGRQGATDDAFH
jgi:hypothetical protein